MAEKLEISVEPAEQSSQDSDTFIAEQDIKGPSEMLDQEEKKLDEAGMALELHNEETVPLFEESFIESPQQIPNDSALDELSSQTTDESHELAEEAHPEQLDPAAESTNEAALCDIKDG